MPGVPAVLSTGHAHRRTRAHAAPPPCHPRTRIVGITRREGTGHREPHHLRHPVGPLPAAQTAPPPRRAGVKQAHYLLMIKANQPALHGALRSLPWTQVTARHYQRGSGHRRRESRVTRMLTVTDLGPDFPYAVQAAKITRYRTDLKSGNGPGRPSGSQAPLVQRRLEDHETRSENSTHSSRLTHRGAITSCSARPEPLRQIPAAGQEQHEDSPAGRQSDPEPRPPEPE